jgi:hypothetical protein
MFEQPDVGVGQGDRCAERPPRLEAASRRADLAELEQTRDVDDLSETLLACSGELSFAGDAKHVRQSVEGSWVHPRFSGRATTQRRSRSWAQAEVRRA